MEINGEEYLSAGESAQYLGVSSQTFTKFQKDFKLQSISRPGMGRTKFFKKKDLEPLKEFRPTTNSEANTN
jgi:hypothetical protein